MNQSQPGNRRRFLKQSALTGAGLALGPATGIFSATEFVPAAALGREGRAAASSRITVGVIGLGARGFHLLDELLNEPDAQIVAVCDVDERHNRDRPPRTGPLFGREPAREHVAKQVQKRGTNGASRTNGASGLFVTSDFREVCDRDDIDAIVIATPDHWHALCTLTALRAGKDVYCEKPVTHLFVEGRLVCDEVARRQAIFQTGSQQRSDPLFRRAVEIVRNGLIGDVSQFDVGLPPGYDRPQGDATVTDPPASLDYEFWCGPSPILPYMRARHHRWWRGHRAYGGGVLMDWIGHHNDIAHWAIDCERTGPARVEAVGWKFPETGIYDTPMQYEIRSEYSGGMIGTVSSGNRPGLRLTGSAGWVFVTRGKIEASDPRWLEASFRPGSADVYDSPGHLRNFLDGVKSRRECICPAEIGHRSVTPGHLGYVSQSVGRPVVWNASEEAIVGDSAADALLKLTSYRSQWKLGGDS